MRFVRFLSIHGYGTHVSLYCCRRLTDEVKRRQTAEAAAKQASDKLDFDARVHDQRTKELEERVKAQVDVINALEKRIKALAKDDGSLPATLQKIRDANQGREGFVVALHDVMRVGLLYTCTCMYFFH